jgi:hypothetical protein
VYNNVIEVDGMEKAVKDFNESEKELKHAGGQVQLNQGSNREKKRKKRARVEMCKPSQRRCGRCGKAVHNSRTCR